jgi:hypothetical protein
MSELGVAREYTSPYVHPLEGEGIVASYLKQRKGIEILRAKVLGRFDKILGQIVESGGVRIKNMSIDHTRESGIRIINESDFYFLFELRNVKRGEFMSALFDNFNYRERKSRK